MVYMSVCAPLPLCVHARTVHTHTYTRFFPSPQMIIDKPLLHRVKVEESMWSIETDNGCCIYINLEKTKEVMWKSVLEGEEGIDLTKVDTTRNISEFDEEAQAAIQRVTYDHHMKMLGKPTSNEKVWQGEIVVTVCVVK